ncbi:MAG: 50S ribosomal protein L4 [Patescibacteria group bacterium]|nr:50S ribosomal protein L4 [Patescibacteria group bacterium]
MQTQIYNQKGKEVDKVDLPEEIFGLPWNDDLVHQVVVSMSSNRRDNIAHTKNRGDVRGGGKKPWKQKGTGRARHGSNRSPLWRGGGVTFGPTSERNWSKKINKKAKIKALFSVLSHKMKDGEILFVDELKFEAPKTKEAKDVLGKLSGIKGFEDILSKKRNSTYLALGGRDESTEKSFSNFGNVLVGELRNINPLDILNYKYLVITKPEESIEFLVKKLNSSDKVVEKTKEEVNSKPSKMVEQDPKPSEVVGQGK